jgi:lipid-A-disaccharide synthase-like uncharacterized protein
MPASWPLREIAGVVLIAALFVVPGMVRTRRPRLDPVALWSLTALGGVLVLILAPFQLIAVLLVAGVYVLTFRRLRVMPATLTAGALAVSPSEASECIHGLDHEAAAH